LSYALYGMYDPGTLTKGIDKTANDLLVLIINAKK
jgi:hypothetical protein